MIAWLSGTFSPGPFISRWWILTALVYRHTESNFLRAESGYYLLLSKSLPVIQHDFEKSLAEIPHPITARSISQLKEISQRLEQLKEPDNLPDSLKQANAIHEKSFRLGVATMLSGAAEEIRQQYLMVLREGNEVLKNKNEPKLPERIREVFALAKDLKTPENDKDKPLPGSDRLTYAAVFQLAEIQSLLGEWKKLREKLEPAARTPQR